LRSKDHVILNIESIAFGGQGVGRIDNFVIFVPYAAPEDVLEVEIVEVKKKFARGRIMQIIQASPWREKPLCRYYGKCGGCDYQHIIYEEQLKIKTRQVREVFQRIGKIDEPPAAQTIASLRVYSYRGKAQLHNAITARGRKTGFMDISGGKIVDIDRCEIMEETINNKISLYRDNPEFAGTEDVTIWSQNYSGEKEDEDFVLRLVKGREFLAARGGFFQANLYMTDRLVDEVCRLAGEKKLNTVVDAYCGSGLFSFFLSLYADNVIGIELSEQSVRYAQMNTAGCAARNVSFICGDVETVFREGKLLPEQGIDLIVLDPPRAGCPETLLTEIAVRKPGKIIYVSCNPATQARDVKFLNGKGYNLLELLPLDMFPQTQHIEVLCLLIRK
jgi:23S rRNA (uracil1939-C5)-methyltransferase